MRSIDDFKTLDFLRYLGDQFSSVELCRWEEDLKNEYKGLLDSFEKSNNKDACITRQEKGKVLEDISSFLLSNCSNIFCVKRNIRTSTNEIDNIFTLSNQGKILTSVNLIPVYYENFIGECKNYGGSIGVTYVGKFCSLMLTTGCRLGILFSYHGVTGHGWKDGSGLIRKFYLHKEKPEERYCLIDFNINDFRAILEGKNFLQIIDDKIAQLRFDTDFSDLLSAHPAESDL